MTEGEREELKRQLDDLGKAESELREARRPFDKAISAIDDVRYSLLERHGVEGDDYDTCEDCDMPIFTGEPIFSYDDGPAFCGEHAPTRADLKKNIEANLATDDHAPEDVESMEGTLAAYEEYVRDGGPWDDKVTYPR